jgi:membrane protein YqaA with SNARE-associated domain
MFKTLYEKSLKLAAHKSSKFFLSLVAFAESSFFPIHPDIMIIPMVVSKKDDYIKIFIIATISSALGGLFGYFIGYTFIDLGMNVVQFYGYEEKVINLKNDLTNGSSFFIFVGALFLAGFTPLPFKVFTITSGIIGFNILIFFLICLFSRGIRFFVISYLTFKFGIKINNFIIKQKTKWFVLIIFLIIIVATILYLIFK